MMGDFNTNMLKTRDPDTKRLKSLMESHGLNQLINTPTRISPSCPASLTDLIFTNSDKVSQSGTLNANVSDHEIIYVTKKHKKAVKESLNKF